MQASVFGPVAFSLFINDLPASLPSSVRCSLYVDDLAIWSSSPSVPTAVEATQGALFRLERWSEYWCLPLNQSKCEVIFFLVNFHQANPQPHFLLLGTRLRFSSTPAFLGLTFDRTLSFSNHVCSLKAEFFPRLKALRCISACSWGPLRSPSLSCIKLFFGPFSPMPDPDGFFSQALPISSNWNASSERPVAPSPAASRPPLFVCFSPRLLYLPYESP